MVEINGKVYRNLQEQVEKNKEDIEYLKEHGTGGETYTAGYGLTFGDPNEFEIDSSVVATKEDIPEIIANPEITELDNPIQLENLQVDDDKYWIPTDTSDLTNGAGFITSSDLPEAGQGITITDNNKLKANIGYGLKFSATESDTDEIIIDTDVVATKEDLIDYHAGTNVNFTPHSGTSGFDINVPMKTINGNPINGIGNITLATLTEKFFRVNITVGNPVTKTWYYIFRAESSLDTTLTGTAALAAYVPIGAIVYCPDDKCLYTIANIAPNAQSTIAKYDGTTEYYITAAFVNTTVQAL